MTVKQLKAVLANLPESYDKHDVFIEESNTGYDYNLVESVFLKEITLSEDGGGETAEVDVLVISNELYNA